MGAWMVGYWLVAGIASFVLLAGAEATTATWSGLTLVAVAALAAGLARSFGVDLVELIWWTAEAPAGIRGGARKLHGIR